MTVKPEPIYVFLSELTVLTALFRAARGQRIYVVGITPCLPFLENILTRFSAALYRSGVAQDAFELLPGEAAYRDIPTIGPRGDYFIKQEPWSARFFRFSDWEKHRPDYALPFKHAASRFVEKQFAAVHAIHDISLQAGDAPVHIRGVAKSFVGLFEACHGAAFPGRSRALEISGLINAVTLFLILCRTFASIAVGMFRPATDDRKVLLAVDFNGRQRDLAIWSDIVDQRRDLLLVCRNVSAIGHADESPYSWDTLDFKGLSVSRAAALFCSMARDSFQNFRFGSGLPPALYYEVAKFSYRRAMFRAFLERRPLTAFLGRDDYNWEHIIRSQELRKAGKQSLGVNHGLPVFSLIEPTWRYIDFDIYYTFGSHLYNRYYKETWSPQTVVKPVGSIEMTYSRHQRLGQDRGNDIVYFSAPYYGHRIISEVFEIARMLPDRRVLIKVKASRRAEGRETDLLEALADSPENVRESREDSYDLLLRTKFVLAATSSIAAESIQFGAIPLVFDPIDRDKPFYYRDFPDLCVNSAKHAVAKMQAYENGEAEFRRDSFEDLIDVSGQFGLNRIRQDLGLPPKGPNKSIGPAPV